MMPTPLQRQCNSSMLSWPSRVKISLSISATLILTRILQRGQADIIVCPSKLLYHVQCPGCGITRATLKFLHFDITGAFRLNPNVVLSVLFIFLSPIVLLIDFMANKNISFKLYSSVDALLHKRFVWIPFLLIELSIWIHNIWSDI